MSRPNVLVLLVTAALAGCGLGGRDGEGVSKGLSGQRLSAGPGNVVLDVKVAGSAPSPGGLAALNPLGPVGAGARVIVRYEGARGKTARLIRQDVVATSGDAEPARPAEAAAPADAGRRARRTPAGAVPAATPSRLPLGVAASGPPVAIDLDAGGSVVIETTTLTVVEVSPTRLTYTLR